MTACAGDDDLHLLQVIGNCVLVGFNLAQRPAKPPPMSLSPHPQNQCRGDLDLRQRRHGGGEIRRRHRDRLARADLGGPALLRRRGRDRHHLAGGAGVRRAGRRGTSLRPRQVREPGGAVRHRAALCAGRRHPGRILEPPARGRRPADAVGDTLRGAGDRYRGEFLARAGAASHGARDPQPGAGGGRAAFRLRRARLDRRHHRAGADGLRLCLGRLRPRPSRLP